MTYDLLINTNFSNKYYVYEKVDTPSLAFSISRNEVKDNLSFVFIREVTPSRLDTWRYFDCEAATYSELHKVDVDMNGYLSSKFKKNIGVKYAK